MRATDVSTYELAQRRWHILRRIADAEADPAHPINIPIDARHALARHIVRRLRQEAMSIARELEQRRRQRRQLTLDTSGSSVGP